MEDLSLPRTCSGGLCDGEDPLPQDQSQEGAVVGPKGPYGKEIKTKVNYKRVMPFARISKEDFLLDKIIDDL
jgi:hypothetical protein